MTTHIEPRRQFLRGVGAGTVALAVGSSLASCRTDTTPVAPPAEDPNTGITLPTHRRHETVEPDLPGDDQGVPDAYFTFPEHPDPATEEKPGTGGTVTAMISLAGSTPVPGLGSNPWWQSLNDRLGVELQPTMVAQDYNAKVSTSIAGGDVADLVQMPALPRLPELLQAEFEDLTEYLSGDAVLEFPNLAALPGYMWQTTIRAGAIRAVPPGNIVGQPTWTVRQDVLDQVGADLAAATDADSMAALFSEVTDARTNQYALADRNRFRSFGELVAGAPNGWIERDGAFTHKIETEEYLVGLEYLARLWSEGVVHPDTFGSVNAPELFQGGKLTFFSWGGVGYRSLLDIEAISLSFWAPPLVDGSGVAPKRLGTGTYMLCAMRKQDSPDRVRELLRILDYLAAPFGSEEYLFLKFGERGVHHTWDATTSAPIPTDALATQRFHASTLASRPFELFDPGHTDVTEAMYDHQVETIPTGMRDDAASLWSPTSDERSAAVHTAAYDAADNLIQGRLDASGWADVVSEWRAAGGDQMRAEFEASFAEQNG